MFLLFICFFFFLVGFHLFLMLPLPHHFLLSASSSFSCSPFSSLSNNANNFFATYFVLWLLLQNCYKSIVLYQLFNIYSIVSCLISQYFKLTHFFTFSFSFILSVRLSPHVTVSVACLLLHLPCGFFSSSYHLFVSFYLMDQQEHRFICFCYIYLLFYRYQLLK